MQSGRAGISDLAVDRDKTFLADIGVDAAIADRQRRILLRADPDQRVEHRSAWLERHRELLVSRYRFVGGAAAYAQACDRFGHLRLSTINAPLLAIAIRCERAQAGSVSGKSSR